MKEINSSIVHVFVMSGDQPPLKLKKNRSSMKERKVKLEISPLFVVGKKKFSH